MSPELAPGERFVTVKYHAITRFRQRVARGASDEVARAVLRQVARCAPAQTYGRIGIRARYRGINYIVVVDNAIVVTVLDGTASVRSI